MDKIVKYKNRKILVLGLAKSGFYAAKLLYHLGANITVNDAQDLSRDEKVSELERLGIEVISGSHPDNLMEKGYTLIVKNPGIPYKNSVVKQAVAMNIPVVTEVEIATEIMKAHIIGVTGTNGKTTTTSIIQQLLSIDRNVGEAYAIGNIGVPASQVALSMNESDDAVMELSSFQLEGAPTIHPDIAVITNLYSAHLDYHGSQVAYENAKMNLIRNQTENDIVVFNKDQEHLTALVKQNTKARLLPFSRKEFLSVGTSVKEGVIYFNGEKVIAVSDIFLAGEHNLENMLAAIAVAKVKNVPNQVILQVAQNFRGVKHRTQFVTKLNKRVFYNDSKATNIEATEMAIAGFDQPIILLAGGLDRGVTFEALIPLLKKNVKALVTFGETADLLVEVANEARVPIIKKTEDVQTAVPIAYELSDPGDVILLSPAAASWDQYPNFEIRGDKYIEAIKHLKNN